jgi:hypothetical protein
MPAREEVTAKHRARLARMRPNSGHAKVLRAKLGITDAPDAPVAPEPAPVPEVVKQPKKKGVRRYGKKKK